MKNPTVKRLHFNARVCDCFSRLCEVYECERTSAHTLTHSRLRVSASLSVSPGLCGWNRNYSGVGGKREREKQTTQDAEIVTGTDCEYGLTHAVLDAASGWMCLQSVE